MSFFNKRGFFCNFLLASRMEICLLKVRLFGCSALKEETLIQRYRMKCRVYSVTFMLAIASVEIPTCILATAVY